jgi:hypothetical protein
MGPTYLPSDIFSETFLAPPIPDRSPPPPFFFSGVGQFVLCGGNQFILDGSGLHGDW